MELPWTIDQALANAALHHEVADQLLEEADAKDDPAVLQALAVLARSHTEQARTALEYARFALTQFGAPRTVPLDPLLVHPARVRVDNMS